jgi:hypothetical protein
MSLPLIGYLIACLVVAFGLTFLLSMFRSVKKTDDFKSWRWIAGFFIAVTGIPYLYADVMTRMHGDGMEKAVKSVLKAGRGQWQAGLLPRHEERRYRGRCRDRGR